ncbi:hypothetical protein PGT21_017270 [Puccinia graminis f. sp. tritici]|uniref:DUF4219 domain-containing protein n=1 Tax=Puccinia graminis f. sp. tritici TaxID=56615 RepID=A0A5B0LP42_PUCGR|nr:hypothetical protein PGT21_017270 [Puccinia graminis f. sp. tritici]
MSDNHGSSALPILTNTNFSKWKELVYAYGLQKGFNKFLTSDRLATATDAQKDAWEEKRMIAAGVLNSQMGPDHRARFITKDNREEPHLVWKLLCDHFEAQTTQNQAKNYIKFLDVAYNLQIQSFRLPSTSQQQCRPNESSRDDNPCSTAYGANG